MIQLSEQITITSLIGLQVSISLRID